MPRCLDSLINQTFSDIEIICIDNNSTDKTEDVVRRFQAKHPNVSYIKNNKNVGANANITKAFEYNKKEFEIPGYVKANDGKYYLICNFDKYDDISNYRLDRIMNLKILDESVKPFKSLIGADGQSLDLVKYMKEHNKRPEV